MIIRKEEARDYENVYLLIKQAFNKAEHSDHNEHSLVNNLRKSEAFIPDLSLVAEIDNNIVGHVMFTKAKIKNTTVLALAPLSVLPEYQKRGIGLALIKKRTRNCKRIRL